MATANTDASLPEVRRQERVAPSTLGHSRVASIDIFRGLTILVMIFVNDLAGVKDLPWWTYHLPGNVNGMTYVDMVFPFFLFIVGISLPLAVHHRLSKNGSITSLWVHIITRSFALVVLGIALANGEKADALRTGVNGNVWLLLTLAGAILFWNVYPRSGEYRTLFKGMKAAGLLLMVAMFAIFRRTGTDGHAAWLDFSYWEILGLIGWTYLAVAILYIPTRRWRWAPLAWLVCLVALNAASLAHWITFSAKLPYYFWPWNTGCFCLLTMAGIVTSTIFLSDTLAATAKQKALWAIAFASALFLAGWLLTPLGISKIRATPTWGLYSAGAATLAFLALYWVCDVHKHVRWTAIVKPAGSNTLLTYLLPDLFFVTLGSLAWVNPWGHGWQGVMQSLIFTLLILGISAILTRYKLRMQL
jgi:heparan-alpha-glucosaminide N-acetyltransferase